MLAGLGGDVKVVMRGDLRCGCLQKCCSGRQLRLVLEGSFLSDHFLCFLGGLCIFAVPCFPSTRYTHTLYASEKEIILALFPRVNLIPAAST